MLDFVYYKEVIPSPAVRTLMNMKLLSDISLCSLVVNGSHTQKKQEEILKMLSKNTLDNKLKKQIEGFMNSDMEMEYHKNEFPLLYSYVEIFNPFERGDIVYNVHDRERIGIVLTSQRYWTYHTQKCRNTLRNMPFKGWPDYSDTLIKVEFINGNREMYTTEISPIDIDFVKPGCCNEQYNYLKSVRKTIKSNGNFG